ncbi:unnamed protein product, partial [Prunus brigantina]
ITSQDRLRHSTIFSALGPPLCPHGFVSGNSRATSQWVTYPGIALAPTRLTSDELPKGLVLDGGRHVHIRHITPSPLVDVGCYNPPPLGARRPRQHNRTTR